jgi:hypothetical protein
MQRTLENRNKVVTECSKNALKRKKKVEEGGASRSTIKK